MKKLSALSLHIIGWVIVFFVLYGSYLSKKNITFPHIALSLSITIVQFIEFYICYLWVYPRFMKPGKVLQLTGGIFVALGTFISLRYLIEEKLYPYFFDIRNYDPNVTFRDYVGDNIYFGGGYILLAGAVWGIVQAYGAEKRHALLQAESKKAEMAFLKSQINPHFLYNTLNYIYSLAIPISDKLSEAILRLSGLMRYTLSDSPDGMVMISREIEYLESYIALFKMRFEPAFYVNFYQKGINDQKIAPLLLIPLMENSFKHGIMNDSSNPIQISLTVADSTLTFTVKNKINHAQKDHSSGIGLINIERRLKLLYAGQHKLDIENNNDYYKASLTIKLNMI